MMRSQKFIYVFFLAVAYLLSTNGGIARGAVIFSEPSGAQLVEGSTRAIWIGDGEEKSFSIFLDTSGLQFDLQSITYQRSVDQTELQFV